MQTSHSIDPKEERKSFLSNSLYWKDRNWQRINKQIIGRPQQPFAIEDAADILNVSDAYVSLLIKDGKLAAISMWDTYFVNADDLWRYRRQKIISQNIALKELLAGTREEIAEEKNSQIRLLTVLKGIAAQKTAMPG